MESADHGNGDILQPEPMPSQQGLAIQACQQNPKSDIFRWAACVTSLTGICCYVLKTSCMVRRIIQCERLAKDGIIVEQILDEDPKLWTARKAYPTNLPFEDSCSHRLNSSSTVGNYCPCVPAVRETNLQKKQATWNPPGRNGLSPPVIPFL